MSPLQLLLNQVVQYNKCVNAAVPHIFTVNKASTVALTGCNEFATGKTKEEKCTLTNLSYNQNNNYSLLTIQKCIQKKKKKSNTIEKCPHINIYRRHVYRNQPDLTTKHFYKL